MAEQITQEAQEVVLRQQLKPTGPSTDRLGDLPGFIGRRQPYKPPAPGLDVGEVQSPASAGLWTVDQGP